MNTVSIQFSLNYDQKANYCHSFSHLLQWFQWIMGKLII